MSRNIAVGIENLVNSKIVEEWVFLFEQKLEKEKLRNSEYMKLHSKDIFFKYMFFDEDEKLEEIEKAEKKIKIKLKKIEKIEAKIEKIEAKNKEKIKKNKNEKEIEDLKNEKTRLNKKIACLHLLIDDKKEEVKDLELQRCKILEEKSKNEKNNFLSKEDREIRDIENKIWKIILDNYFQDKSNKKLILKEYEEYASNFKKTIKELKIGDKKCYDALLDIVTTLYKDVSRDKLFLERENIKTDGWQDINLDEDSTRLQNLSLENKFKPSL
ncbi:hypothetical protein [Spiroplasma endosymbiont of Tricholauxania praeusta]|uniref:hypothetical protein n=1 Tax=Spiroplasma endosymbiont of Tricholauxania praeusta TaxID=3066296 RepID=UPI0030D36FE6